jgi:hypothetical protein
MIKNMNRRCETEQKKKYGKGVGIGLGIEGVERKLERGLRKGF